MALNTNKLKVSIETSIDKGFANLAGQLDKLAESLQKIDKLTGAFTLLANQMDISNKTRKNTKELTAQEKALKRLNAEMAKEFRLIIASEKANEKAARAVNNYRAATQAKLKQIQLGAKVDEKGNILPSESRRVAADKVLAVVKEIKNTKDFSLLSLLPNTREFAKYRKDIQTNVIEPMKRAQVGEGLAKAFTGWNNFIKQQNKKPINVPVKLNFKQAFSEFGNIARLMQKENADAERAIKGQLLYHNLNKASQFTNTASGSKFIGQNMATIANMQNMEAKRAATAKREAAIQMEYDALFNSKQAQTITKRAGLNPDGTPIVKNKGASRVTRAEPDSGIFGGLGNAIGSPIFDRPIPSKKAQNDSLNFSNRLYRSYAKLGEVLFRIQYATLTIANLGGAIAFAQMSDSFMAIESSIGRVSSTTEEFNTAMNETRKIARETYMSYEAVAGIYSKIAFEANKYNLTQEQTLRLTRTIAVLSAAGGGKAGSQDQALYQFQQSISSGKFGGDELRSVFEGAPMLARALAAGVQGTTLGNADISKLRPTPGGKNVATGDLLKGLQSEVVQAEVEKLARTLRGTFGGAVTNLVSSLTVAAGRLNQFTGASVKVNNFVKVFDDYLLMTDKEAKLRQETIMRSTQLTSEEIREKVASLQQYYKNIVAARDLTKQLVFMATAFLAVKAASLAASGATAGVKALGRGTSAAYAAGSSLMSFDYLGGTASKSEKAAKSLFGLAAAAGTVAMNILKVTLKFGGVAFAASVLWKVFGNLTAGTKYAGKEFQIFIGALLTLGEKIKEVIVIIANAISSLISWVAGEVSKLLKTTMEAKNKKNEENLAYVNANPYTWSTDGVIGKKAGLEAIQYGMSKYANKDQTSMLDELAKKGSGFNFSLPSLTGGGFGGNGNPPAADASDADKKKAEKIKNAFNDYTKLLADIKRDTSELMREATFGSFFGTLRSQFDREVETLKETFKDIGGIPQKFLDNLKAANKKRVAAATEKELRNLQTNFAFDSRASRMEERGSIAAGLDASQTSIVKDFIKYLPESKVKSAEDRIANMMLDTSVSARDMADALTDSGLSVKFQTQLFQRLNEETAKVNRELSKMTDEVKVANKKNSSENLFDYNQAARGVFGRKAEQEKKVYQAEQEAIERLVSKLGTGNADLYGKTFAEVADVYKDRMFDIIDSNLAKSTGSSKDVKGVDTLIVKAKKDKSAVQQNIDAEQESINIVKRNNDLLERLTKSPWVGAQRAATAYLDTVRDVATQTENILTNAFQKLEDMFVNFIETGKFEVGDFLKSIAADVLRMIVKQRITGPIVEWLAKKFPSKTQPKQEGAGGLNNVTMTAGVVYLNANALNSGAGTGQEGGITSLWDKVTSFFKGDSEGGGNFFTKILDMFKGGGKSGGSGNIFSTIMSMFSKGGGSGGGGGGDWISTAANIIASIFHGGGMAHSPTNFRSVSPSLFVNAPKFHSGKMPQLAANEIPAILTKDEMVLTRSQQKAIGSSRGGRNLNFSPTINLSYNAAENADAAASQRDAEEMAKIMNQQVEVQFKRLLVKELGQGGMLRNSR